jgi:hypothetical protein
MRGLDQRREVQFFKHTVIEDNFFVAKDVVSESITTYFKRIL